MSSVKRTIVGTRSTGSPLSPAVRYGDLLFVSGQTAADAVGREAQAHAVLKKIRDLLKAAGATSATYCAAASTSRTSGCAIA